VSAKPCPWDSKMTLLAFAGRAFGEDFSFVRSLSGAMMRADLYAAYEELKERNVLSSPWFHFSDRSWTATKQLGFAANYTQLLHQVRVVALRTCCRRVALLTRPACVAQVHGTFGGYMERPVVKLLRHLGLLSQFEKRFKLPKLFTDARFMDHLLNPLLARFGKERTAYELQMVNVIDVEAPEARPASRATRSEPLPL